VSDTVVTFKRRFKKGTIGHLVFGSEPATFTLTENIILAGAMSSFFTLLWLMDQLGTLDGLLAFLPDSMKAPDESVLPGVKAGPLFWNKWRTMSHSERMAYRTEHGLAEDWMPNNYPSVWD